MKRFALSALAGIVMSAGLCVDNAAAQGLFAPSTAKSGPMGTDDSVGVVRSRPTDIDMGYLFGQASDAAKGGGQSTSMRLNFFDDVTADVELWDTAVAGSSAERVLSGWVPQSEDSLATIVVGNGQVRGKVWMDGALYRFRPEPGGGYAIAEVDTTRFPEAQDSPLPGERIGSKAISTARVEGEPIDLLVLFTERAAKKTADFKNETALWVAEMNEIHRRSGSAKDNMFRLVGVRQVDYLETRQTKTDVERLAGKTDGFMDDVHKLRDQLGADLVSLVYTGGRTGCGRVNAIGPNPGEPQADTEAAFSVVAFSCASDNLSFAHELGHNIGARHDYLADGTKGYHHGYVYVPARWRTVMAYNTKCANAGTNCRRLPFFSNPYKAFKGKPTGIHKNKPSPAFNVDLILKNRAYIAAFRRAVKPTQTTTTTTTTGVAEMKCPVPAGAGSPSGTIGGLPYWQGHFFVGLNYGKAYAKSREECHRACAADKNCTSWTWIARQKKCVFKHYCPKKTFTQGPMEVSGFSGRPSVCGNMRPGCGLEAAAPAVRTAPTQPAPAPAPAPQQPSGWQVIN